jgi:hypothetical protein
MITGVVTWTLAELEGSGSQQPPSRGQAAGGVMDQWQPAGAQATVWADQYEKDTEGGWVWGNHREATEEQLQQMKDMVRQHGSALPTAWQSFQATTSQSA